MDKKKVLIFVVSYNAEDFISATLERIPPHILHNTEFHTEVLIIDDSSTDHTFNRAMDFAQRNSQANVTILYNPKNQGYGGNQKIGYHYALHKGFDVVVLLHGDGQYAPEYLGQMIQPILQGEADVVLGSRMLDKFSALKGKMPLYKWISNQILTALQNVILNSHLSEFHTGYRAYRVSALASVPFQYNSDYFDFDTDILIQMLDTRKRIKEIAIPTFYGDEISRVNVIRYGLSILTSSLLSRVMRWGILYHPKFDYLKSNEIYNLKLGYPSSHEYALSRVRPHTTVLDIGCGPGLMTRQLAQRDIRVIAIDRSIQPEVEAHAWKTIQADVDQYDFQSSPEESDTILALDIIEHLRSPESFLTKLRQRYGKKSPQVILTTGNIAFFPIRFALLLGQFNYGRRGILDLDHTRLFTFHSLQRLLVQCGYEVEEIAGIPAPFPLALGDHWYAHLMVWANVFLIHLSKTLFSYQIAIIARPRPTLDHLLDDAQEFGEKLRKEPLLTSEKQGGN